MSKVVALRRELDVTRQGVLEGKRTAATLRHELLQVEQQASAAADAHQAEVPILTLTLMADAHQAQVLDSIDRWLHRHCHQHCLSSQSNHVTSSQSNCFSAVSEQCQQQCLSNV